MEQQVVDFINENMFGIWFLIGAALVFWMQAGFAMVETGFTRAKNAGNIIMKNLMDFCIGTVVFILIGFLSCWERISLDLSESRDLIFLQRIQILIFQILYLT